MLHSKKKDETRLNKNFDSTLNVHMIRMQILHQWCLLNNKHSDSILLFVIICLTTSFLTHEIVFYIFCSSIVDEAIHRMILLPYRVLVQQYIRRVRYFLYFAYKHDWLKKRMFHTISNWSQLFIKYLLRSSTDTGRPIYYCKWAPARNDS